MAETKKYIAAALRFSKPKTIKLFSFSYQIDHFLVIKSLKTQFKKLDIINFF